MLKKENKVWRNEKTASRILEGEAVILTPEDSKVHCLNEVGSRIWELLAEKPTVGEIISKIYEEFEVSKEQAETDVLEFLKELKSKEMITVS